MADHTNGLSPRTIAAHAAGRIDDATGGVVGAIQTATTFVRDEAYQLPPSGDIYRRDNNATVRDAEAVITALEGAANTKLFASGLAAVAAMMRCAGGPIALQRGLYYGSAKLAQLYAAQGQTIVEFDPTDLSTLDTVIREHAPTLIHIETPSNPWISIVDIAGAAERAHAAGAVLSVDSTAATPALSQPLSLGADLVIHSATKALNGHSDVLAGSVSVADTSLPIWERIQLLRAGEGAVLGPFDAFLLTRGMRTLHVRMAEMCRNAMHIAGWLQSHSKVETVRYPGIPTHPQHNLAAAQMSGGYGSLLSFDVVGGADAALAALSRLTLIKRATSLGGVESLIEHRYSIEPPFTGMPPGLLRLSVGIEAVDDLVADLNDALAGIG